MKSKRILLTLSLVGVLALAGCDPPVRQFLFEGQSGTVNIPTTPPRAGTVSYVSWLEDHITRLAASHCTLWAQVDTLTDVVQDEHGDAVVPDLGPCAIPFPDPPPPWPPS